MFLANVIPNQLNPDQAKVMSACASMCTSNMNTPQAAIIQGPPGTGKSTTIAAMVLQIIFRWKRQYPGKQTQITYFSCIRVRSPIESSL